MDLTKEALDYLAEQGIEPKERRLEIGGQNYIINKDGDPVLVEPVIYKAKEPIRLNTLSGLVDYIKSNIDGFDDLILHVVDEKLVELKGKLQPNGDRELLAVADDLGKIINIVGKHLKRINYEWRNIEWTKTSITWLKN